MRNVTGNTFVNVCRRRQIKRNRAESQSCRSQQTPGENGSVCLEISGAHRTQMNWKSVSLSICLSAGGELVSPAGSSDASGPPVPDQDPTGPVYSCPFRTWGGAEEFRGAGWEQVLVAELFSCLSGDHAETTRTEHVRHVRNCHHLSSDSHYTAVSICDLTCRVLKKCHIRVQC